ncbi:MAG TPA: M43 family zinc metalloprotease, partial [Abditibacteriaceae bacterium]
MVHPVPPLSAARRFSASALFFFILTFLAVHWQPAQAQDNITSKQAAAMAVRKGNTSWCGTEKYTQSVKTKFDWWGNCPREGACDDPASRDAAIPTSSTAFKIVRLRFVILRNTDGTNPAATQAEVDAQVQQLNLDFKPAHIAFTYTTVFKNSTNYRSIPHPGESPTEGNALKTAYAANTATSLNVYVTNLEQDSTGNGLLGIATFPWDDNALTATGGTFIEDDAFGAGQKTATHEIGHNLGLYHTHRGVSDYAGCDMGCHESPQASASDRDTNGDYASDTPPTPVNFNCGDPAGGDSCTNPVQPWGTTQPENYMSYAPDACYTLFTSQQKGRLQCWTNASLSGWLVTDTTDPTISITTPANGGPFYTLAAVDGTANDNSSINYINVALRRVSDGAWYWWTGNAWSSSNFGFASHTKKANGTYTWSSLLPDSSKLTNGQYELNVQAVDVSGNDSEFITRTFTIDTAGPRVAVTSPGNGSKVSGFSAISGTISDASVIRDNRVEFTLVNGGQYWTGSGWGAYTTLYAPVSNGTWTYSNVPLTTNQHSGSYSVVAKAYDILDNVSASQTNVSSITFSVDNT